MPEGDGTTIGVWVAADDRIVDRVDERLGYGDSRSQYVKDAMRLQLTVEDALETADLEFDSEREKRAFLRQAVLDAAPE